MALKAGDTVRMRMVATVTAVAAQGIRVTSFGGTVVDFPREIADDPGFAYEEIPAPEPAYTAGELYRDADGNVFQRMATDKPGDRWRVVVHENGRVGQYVGELAPVRPLVHLIPETPATPPVDPAVPAEGPTEPTG
jgi:hypothetical protein